MKPSLVIIGLGNPGMQYVRTRHNVGFQALDFLANVFGEGNERQLNKLLAVGMEAFIGTVPVLLLKPNTFMNLSGNSVKKIVDYYKLNPSNQILILCDDIDLPLGDIRLREKGGPGTHNGLRSIHAIFGDDFPRLRIGLGAPKSDEDLAAWVLSIPSLEEEKKLEKSISSIPEIIQKYVMEI